MSECVPAHQCAGARNIEPLSPEAATAAADAASLILTVCGLGVDACDVGSAIVDVFNGDPLGAAASGPSAVPLLGIPVGVTKIARKLEKITDAAGDGSKARKGLTEPTLPEKTIVKQDGITIEHNYKSGDHGPAHAEVRSGGPKTNVSLG